MADVPPKLSLAVTDRDHFQGFSTAGVTLVEYGDYQCPHCREVNPVVKELQRQMGDRLRYVFRHFPISTAHPQARLAAEAAEAAGAQGKFWEMHELLFANQHALNMESLLGYARQLGLDQERFRREIEEGVYSERVREDFSSGVRSGVNGTPTFFINGRRYDGAWDLESMLVELEKPLGVQIRLLVQEFTRIQASGGILLIIATVLALLWANSPWAEAYFHLWETNFTIALGQFEITAHLEEWVNDGLMVLFFFVVGLEIKREVLDGELGSPRRAALPLAAAIGGLTMPALLYFLINAGTEGAAGWGIPMATDIAFTLGILVLLGSRIPLSLKVFFTALAIADDIGAVLVIAIFYTTSITWAALGVAGLILVLLILLNRAQVYGVLPYLALGFLLWLAFLQSGVHPTLAGVLLALVIPNRSRGDPKVFLAQCSSILSDYGDVEEAGPGFSPSSRQLAATQTLESITERMQSPSQRLERSLHPWSTYVVLPIFAFANAGVTFAGGFQGLANPVSIGIILGLLVGKPLGISLFSWLAVRLGLAQLPRGVPWRQLLAASVLGGIGFTISLFIAGRAFSDPSLLAAAKLAILGASLVAGIVGYVVLTLVSPRHDETTAFEPGLAPAD